MRRSLISSAVLALTVLSSVPALAATAPAATNAGQVTTQLPRNAVPTHYAVALVPHAATSSFDGTVTIALDIKQATSTLTLNAADLVFHNVSISAGPSQPPLAASHIAVDAAQQTATFSFDHPLQPGSYQLQMTYSGSIGTQANGLFSLDYATPEGSKRALYTQFENSDARRMIPSWDEPSYKASFALEVTVPANQMAVSNMPAASTTELPDGLKLVRFATTPKMSTYLLFFGLGEFDRVTASEGGTELGVVTQKGAAASQAQFALDSSVAVLHEYNDYFGVKYPLPKLDNVAAPGRSQFFSAMENWGAIFTFEYSMLLDPAISTQHDKEEVFLVAAHEMAHQWFGDLVTMAWWDDLWLNEGFASWMESRTTHRLHPEWHTELNAIGVREAAMERDAIATTHPVVQHVATVEQASMAFDSITYSKGESVIRMLENYVGADTWREGVRAYIKAHAYGNTVSDDLWRAMEQAGHKPVTSIAHEFTLQPGVPLIRVADAVCKNGSTRITLSQGEFSKDQPNKKPLVWHVPVTAMTLGGASASTLVHGAGTSLTVPGCGPVLVNAGQTGYYRTLYSPRAFAALASSFAQLAPIDQLGVMSDSWSLGLAGLAPASNFLDLVKATPADAAPQVWGKIASVLRDIDLYYAGRPEQRKQFDRYAIARLAPVFERTGWTAQAGEAEPVANLRTSLIAALSALGDPAVIAEARRRYAASASDPTAMPAPIRRAILGVVARHADAATWDQLHAAALAEKSALVKNELYDLLSAPEDAAQAQRALDLALTAEPGATTSPALIAGVAMLHPDLAFNYALEHLAQIDEKVDSTSRSRYFPRLASRSADPATAAKLQAYAEAHLPAGARGDVKTAVANIEYRIKVRRERRPAIDAWLAQNTK